jgi:hypothetical protein
MPKFEVLLPVYNLYVIEAENPEKAEDYIRYSWMEKKPFDLSPDFESIEVGVHNPNHWEQL